MQQADSFTMAINSRRQMGAGGYDMIRSAPVVYDKSENIPDLLMEEVRSRGPVDPAGYAAADWQIVPEVYAVAVRNLSGIAPPPLPAGPRDTVMLRILATADLHGDMLAGAAAAGTMDSLAAACGCPSLRLDAGDAMQGTPLAGETEGRAVVDVLRTMGYSAAALGEHDFDWGTDTLRQRMADAGYPWLAANVFDSASGRRPDWIVPYRVVGVGDDSVAVIGYVSPTAKMTLPDERTRGLRFGEGELALHDLLGNVAAQKPTLTIVLAHAGLDCGSSMCGGEAVRLAEQLERSGVGLIVTGHGHAAGTARAGGIPIVQPDARGASVAVVDLVKTPAGGLEARPRVVTVNSDAVSRDPALLAALQFYRRRSDSVDARPIAQLKRPLPREGAQYPLGGLLAEARRNAVRADVGLVRNETMMADLPAGAVSYARLSAVEPARADIVAVALTGVQLRSALEHALDGGAPLAHIAGAQVRYDPGKPAGRRIKDVVLQGKRDLESGGRYVLAVDAATADGAGGYGMLRGLPVVRGGMMDVEADAAFLRKLPQPVDVGGTAGFVSTRR